MRNLLQDIIEKYRYISRTYFTRFIVFFIFLFSFFLCVLKPVLVSAQTTVSSSSNVTITAVVSDGSTTGTTGTGGSGGGGGGGGGGYTTPTNVTFSGRAYPLSRVILLKDGQEVLNTVAGPDARFNITISNLSTGTFTFSILSEDSQGRRSTLFTIPISVTAGVSSTISGIFLAPTVDIDKQAVKQGDQITIFGQTAPQSTVTISVHSDAPIFEQTKADANGTYFYNLNTASLAIGMHDVQSKAELAATNEVTPYGKVLSFSVGTKTIQNKNTCALLKGDFNGDCRVNLIDFSILAYWYKKSSVPAKYDLNGDGKITLVDFSILAYYWTG